MWLKGVYWIGKGPGSEISNHSSKWLRFEATAWAVPTVLCVRGGFFWGEMENASQFSHRQVLCTCWHCCALGTGISLILQSFQQAAQSCTKKALLCLKLGNSCLQGREEAPVLPWRFSCATCTSLPLSSLLPSPLSSSYTSATHPPSLLQEPHATQNILGGKAH